MDNGEFDSITWGNDGESTDADPVAAGDAGSGGGGDGDDRRRGRHSSRGKQRASTASPQAGRNADALDLAGMGEGRLDCSVSSPQKENEGTKDVFVSYLVTSHVRYTFLFLILSDPIFDISTMLVRGTNG